jgi:hypothetical protein
MRTRRMYELRTRFYYFFAVVVFLELPGGRFFFALSSSLKTDVCVLPGGNLSRV